MLMVSPYNANEILVFGGCYLAGFAAFSDVLQLTTLP
jgi:hypothetical protein